MRKYSVDEAHNHLILGYMDDEYIGVYMRIPKEHKELAEGFCKLLNEEVQGAYTEGTIDGKYNNKCVF